MVVYGKSVDPGLCDGDVYNHFYCTCGESITSGVPCRHFWAAHNTISAAAFTLGFLHPRWITTPGLTTYEIVTTAGVVGTTPRIDPASISTARVMNPLTQTLTDVPIDVFKHSRVCYGKMWGMCRKVTSAINVDSGKVHQEEFEELMATMERLLQKNNLRDEIQVAREEDIPVIRALQNIAKVQDPNRKNNKAKENRLCSYCKQSGGHNRASCPIRIADEAKNIKS